MNFRKNLAIFILCALVSCKGQERTVASQSASTVGGAAASSEYIFGGWASNRLPLSIKVSGDFTTQEQSDLIAMTNKWESAGGRNFVNFSGTAVANKDLNSMNSYLDGSIEVHQVNTAALPSSSLAVTVFNGIVMNSGTDQEYVQINDADILFNYNDFVFNDSPSFGEYDLQSVMLHEVGHLLGINHISGTNSVMNPTITSGTQQRSLFQIDRTSITTNYGLSSTASFAMSVDSSNARETAEPEGEFVSGYFELSADKKCTHVINGKVVHEHKMED